MLEDLVPRKRVYPCKVRDTAGTLEAKDSDILLAAAVNLDWPITHLSAALKEKGILISEHAFRVHREKRCSCFRLM